MDEGRKVNVERHLSHLSSHSVGTSTTARYSRAAKDLKAEAVLQITTDHISIVQARYVFWVRCISRVIS
ncbi:hypothetical protein AW40_29395 [Kosakonia radicincitans UMEnt01/12]|nr:hypothetical protein AW40_29395 [Kosakonia radicincitans UMEnt01/12]